MNKLYSNELPLPVSPILSFDLILKCQRVGYEQHFVITLTCDFFFVCLLIKTKLSYVVVVLAIYKFSLCF